MRVLLSAFACSPIWGSEPGVGWRWAVELAAHHDVVVLTHAYFRSHIDGAGIPDSAAGRLRFEYFDVHWLESRFRPEMLNSRLYYMLWQRGVVPTAARLHREHPFDVVHHLTWGSFRFPSFLWRLQVPFVFGPVGGGEGAPRRLLHSLPLKQRIKELGRDIVRLSARFDPFLMACLRHSDLIFCRTRDTMDQIPAWARHKTFVRHEIGSSPVAFAPDTGAPGASGARLRLLFAGRLLGWKGAHFAVRALARAIRAGVDAQLTLAGDGPMRAELERLSREHEVQDRVKILGFIDRPSLFHTYGESDVFLFPSLHDSGGTVVLEALAHGLPVICLDLGGPPCFVDETCGRVVRTADRDEDGVVAALADAIGELARDEPCRLGLRAGAFGRARQMTWERQVARVYEDIAALSSRRTVET